MVTEVAPLVEYILSGRIELSAGRRADLEEFVLQEFQASGSKFDVSKDPGVFVAIK